jgi:hypothetical protein
MVMKTRITFTLEEELASRLPEKNKSSFIEACIKYGLTHIHEVKNMYRMEMFQQLMNDPYRMEKYLTPKRKR